MTWDELAILAAQILGVVAFFAAFGRAIKAALSTLDARLDEKLEPILHEVQPNSGGSMKDVIHTLHDNQEEMKGLLASMGTEIGVIRAKMTSLIENADVAWYEMEYVENSDGSPSVRMSFVNDAYLHLYQVTLEEALSSLVWRDRINIRDLNRLDAAGAYSLSNKTDYFVEYEMAHQNLLVPVVVRAKTIWVNGNLKGWAGAVTPKWHKAKPLPEGFLSEQLPKPSWL